MLALVASLGRIAHRIRTSLRHQDSRLRQAFILLAATCVVRAFGTAAALAVAFHFGTGPEMDRYIAFSLVMATLGPIVTSPIPVLVSKEIARTGCLATAAQVSRAWSSRIGVLTTIGYIILCPFLARAFTPAGSTGVVDLAILLILGIPVIGAAPFGAAEQAMLQARGFVMRAVWCTAITTGISLAGAIVSGLMWGAAFAAVGVALGTCLELIVLRQLNRSLHEDQRHILGSHLDFPWKSVLVVGASSSCGLLLGLYDQAILAQMGEGAQATWGSAARVPSFVGICLFGVAGILCSARLAAATGPGQLRTETARLFGIILVMSVILMGATCLAAYPLTRALFERGAFGASDTAAVAGIMLWTCAAYFGFSACSVLIRTVGLIGADRTLLASGAAYVVAKLAALHALLPEYGIAAIGVSTLVASASQTGVLGWRCWTSLRTKAVQQYAQMGRAGA